MGGSGHFEAFIHYRVAKYVLLKALALRIGSGRLRGGALGERAPLPFYRRVIFSNSGQNPLI